MMYLFKLHDLKKDSWLFVAVVEDSVTAATNYLQEYVTNNPEYGTDYLYMFEVKIV